MSRQLALPFVLAPAFGSFIVGDSNAEAWAWMADPSAWPGGRLAVHGAEGVGKSHLLHAFAVRHGGVLVPGEAVRYLVDLPEGGAIAVDDADAAPEDEALLHLLNGAAEAGLPVLLAGRVAPAQWDVGLPDLRSRLRAVTAVEIGLPDDGLLAGLLARLLAERQLRVDGPVQAYLLARLPRWGAALREAAVLLDRASLAEGRRVSRAMAGAVVAAMTGDGLQGDVHGAATLL